LDAELATSVPDNLAIALPTVFSHVALGMYCTVDSGGSGFNRVGRFIRVYVCMAVGKVEN